MRKAKWGVIKIKALVMIEMKEEAKAIEIHKIIDKIKKNSFVKSVELQSETIL